MFVKVQTIKNLPLELANDWHTCWL